MSGSRKSYGVVPNAAFGRCSISGLDDCVAAPVSGGKGDTGREVSVSFLDLIAGGALDDRTVPSLKSCSKGCSVAELCCTFNGRGGGRVPVARFASP
jgi:hypothetical protein